jgi:hypothetical protein
MTQDQRRALTGFAVALVALVSYLIAPQLVAGMFWNAALAFEMWWN